MVAETAVETETSKPLLFFDSGVGGLPYLEGARRLLKGEQFIYLADREHFPYGEKPEKQLRELIFATMRRALEKLDPKLVVLACNTATVVALAELRKQFPVPFIGVVPAVKLAARQLPKGKIGILASRRTSSGAYLEGLIKEFASPRQVVRIPLLRAISLVEHDYFTLSRRKRIEILRREISGRYRQGIRALVLGCTHFILLESELREILGDGVRLIDSREGVIRQLIRLLQAKSLAYRGPERHPARDHQFYVTGKARVEERFHRFAGKYGLRVAGTL